VQTLVLDGLSVTAELVHEILSDASFSVRILSMRGARNLNEPKLRQALEYACRPSRPEGMPRLRGLYVLGQEQIIGTSLSALSDGEAWYDRRGNQFPHRRAEIGVEWANTLAVCQGIIAFDAVLCSGPRHGNLLPKGILASGGRIPHPAVATRSLDGCVSCGTAPEGCIVWGEDARDDTQTDTGDRRYSGSNSSDIGRFPLLWPPPLHTTSLKAAMCPAGQPLNPRMTSSVSKGQARFIPRCLECLRGRHCMSCKRWWCELCYAGAAQGQGSTGAATDLVSPPS